MLDSEILQQVLENHIVGFKAPRRQPRWSPETLHLHPQQIFVEQYLFKWLAKNV